MSTIRIQSCAELPDIREQWADLARRANANVFMHPAAAGAAQEAGFARVHTLLAWEDSAAGPRLLGLWTLQIERAGVGPSTLSGLPFNYAFASNPVVDSELAETVVPAFLDAIERDPALPKVLRLRYLDGGCATAAALERAFAARSSPVERLAERERPFVTRTYGLKTSGSTRKKLRQDWNRLSASGTVTLKNDRSAAAACAAFDVFLAMEAASWKGEQGTALLSRPADAHFASVLIARLADAGAASVALLKVDGTPVAAQVMLYCGATAYTWKTAFAGSHAKFSPGALLVDKITETLFAGSEIEAIDSCSADGSFMDQMWAGRRPTLDMLADLGPRRSLGFMSVAAWQKGRAELKSLRNGVGTMGAMLALMGFAESP